MSFSARILERSAVLTSSITADYPPHVARFWSDVVGFLPGLTCLMGITIGTYQAVWPHKPEMFIATIA